MYEIDPKESRIERDPGGNDVKVNAVNNSIVQDC